MLVAGETGSGKTNLIRGIAHDAAVAGCEVRIVDPKRIEMLGLRGMAGVTVATSTRDMVDLVRLTFADMDARYEALEGGADVADLPRLLLVVDEVREWVRRANALWLEQDRADLGIKTGTEHRAVGELASIAAMGRSGRVHLLAGIQRPDAKALGSDGGSMRDNYRARIALGSLSQEGALMMFGGADWGRDVADIPGRGTVSLGGAPFEVQTYRCVESSSNVLTSVATRGRLQT
jgi:DNA segregation ATPase FtsK/SpoIIIE-like protein